VRNVAYITPGALLLSAGLIVGQLVVARWVDLHPILWPAAPVCALISASALLALFVLPVDAISASRRKLIGRLAFFGLILAAVSLCSLYFADQIVALGWLGFGREALAALVGAIAGGTIFHGVRKYCRR
jgi:hypothetical protein